MLLAFRWENARSFRDPMALSLEATTTSEDGIPREIPWRQGDTRTGHVKVLPAAGIFGANAAGKTNALRVMDDMRTFVVYSFQRSTRRKDPHTYSLRELRHPFRLDRDVEARSSTYEIDVIIAGVRHLYGFEVDDSHVISEWAIRFPRGKAATIFRRKEDRLEIKTPGSTAALKQVVKPDVLVLSAAKAVDYTELEPLYSWFEDNLVLASASSREMRWRETLKYMSSENRRDQVLRLLRVADLGITDASPENPDAENLERLQRLMGALSKAYELDEEAKETLPRPDINTVVGIFLSHKAAVGTVDFGAKDESLGTLVWLGMIAPVLRALAKGTVLLADEIESSLHPKLVAELVTMFQNSVSNPNNAQLIFNSHEARLLGNTADDRVIGRDQVWFAEKLNDGSTRLYPLTDSSPRREEAVARRYMEGRYGGTPLISHAEFTALARDIARDGSANDDPIDDGPDNGVE